MATESQDWAELIAEWVRNDEDTPEIWVYIKTLDRLGAYFVLFINDKEVLKGFTRGTPGYEQYVVVKQREKCLVRVRFIREKGSQDLLAKLLNSTPKHRGEPEYGNEIMLEIDLADRTF